MKSTCGAILTAEGFGEQERPSDFSCFPNWPGTKCDHPTRVLFQHPDRPKVFPRCLWHAKRDEEVFKAAGWSKVDL